MNDRKSTANRSGTLPAVVFPTSWLDCPLGGADQSVHRQIMQEIEALEAQCAGDLVTQLRRTLIGGASQAETCLGQIAEIFAIHERTLNRRLKAQGTSFKALIDETRYDVAPAPARHPNAGG